MAHAYTPGLKVAAGITIRSERRLPLAGAVIAQLGDKVQAEDVVATADLPGNVQLVNVANLLSIPAGDVKDYMLKTEGDAVEKNEIIAATHGFWGLFKSQARSPIDGTVESISDVTGQVIMRAAPIPVNVNGYVDGSVVEVIPDEGVIVEAYGTYIQGIFGVGGEQIGTLEVVVDSPADALTADLIQPAHQSKILVGGSIVQYDAIQKAIQRGVKGLIVGGIHDGDLRNLLGYELGVAITGSEELQTTLIITEGFGEISMAVRTFNLLREREGMTTSINGATQIRAGVVRPEIIIPFQPHEPSVETEAAHSSELTIGTPIRIIREPHFGQLGRVAELPVELQELETEAKVRVLEVELENGAYIALPRANVEIIEE